MKLGDFFGPYSKKEVFALEKIIIIITALSIDDENWSQSRISIWFVITTDLWRPSTDLQNSQQLCVLQLVLFIGGALLRSRLGKSPGCLKLEWVSFFGERAIPRSLGLSHGAQIKGTLDVRIFLGHFALAVPRVLLRYTRRFWFLIWGLCLVKLCINGDRQLSVLTYLRSAFVLF